MMSFLSARWLAAFALLAALFLATMFAGALLTPDPVRTRNAADQFSAPAARERLVRILGDETPHPVDSAAQDVVRETLLREITSLGLTPEVRDTFACRPQPRGPLIDCARVRNIIFSIGPESGPTILAAAHYDSVVAAPGASDDGIGLSVWLEIARMLSHETLTRRITFLFSDGEEPGLLGAYAFANSDPLTASVESVINLEARGSRGPAIFFETNQPNADAIAAFANVPRPVANSVSADVYALLSNSSDVTALTRPGLDILNIALLDGLEDYHTPQDNIASQDLRSVQHMGDMALAAVRRLAAEPNANNPTEMVYTDIASRMFVAVPSWAGKGALALSALIVAFAFWRTGKGGRWSALAAPPLFVIAAGAIAFAVGFGLSLARPGADLGFAYPETMRALCALIALLSAVLVLLILRSGQNAEQTGAAAMLWFAIIGGALSMFLGGISILFAVPLVIYALGVLISLFYRPGITAFSWVASIAVLLVWGPLLYLIELALGFEMPFALSILAALALLPWLGLIAQVRGAGAWRGLAIVAGVAASVSVVIAAVAPTMSHARPRSLNVSYFLNTVDGEARILAGSAERALPQTLRDAFAPEFILPGDRAPTWATAAPVADFTPPELQNLRIERISGETRVNARLIMHGAYRALIRIPAAAAPSRVRVNGADASFADTGGESSEFVNLACQGRSCDGAVIEVTLGEGDAPDWYLIGQFPGLGTPEAAAFRNRRGPTATPIQGGDGVTTLSRIAVSDASPSSPPHQR